MLLPIGLIHFFNDPLNSYFFCNDPLGFKSSNETKKKREKEKLANHNEINRYRIRVGFNLHTR